MPSFNNLSIGRPLKGLTASDRTKEEKKVIAEQKRYTQPVDSQAIENVTKTDLNIKPSSISNNNPSNEARTNSSKALSNIIQYQTAINNAYKSSLAEAEEKYGVGRNTTNSNAIENIRKIAKDVSSYYKKYYGSSLLSDNDIDDKKLMAEYEAHKKVYGEDRANMWLDNQFKNIVGDNQPWYDQALNSLGHIIPTIEGGAVQLLGNTIGLVEGLKKLPGNLIDDISENSDERDLNAWDTFMDGILDNPLTRYGRDIEHSGASVVGQTISNLLGFTEESVKDRIDATKATATKYNPEGIGDDAIVTTDKQDESLINSATPWNALYSNGFTLLSMLVTGGLTGASSKIFGGAAKGVSWLNATDKALKTEKALAKTLKSLKAIQSGTQAYVIPGLVGTTEGMMEGLNTKIGIEQEAIQNLDDYYKDKVAEEAKQIYDNDKLNPLVQYNTEKGKIAKRQKSYSEIYKEVWDNYKNAYVDSRRQIEVAASKAGQQNFWTNSLINGMLNSTLKAGLQTKPVKEALRNSKMFGWAYRKPAFSIAEDYTATAKHTKLGTIWSLLKEPTGEGLEEYTQSLSNDTFTGAAENNINEFIKARFNGDGIVKVGQSFSSDWAAALSSLGNSIVNKESIESTMYGALGSVMGTPFLIGKGYHRDANGKLVQNSIFSKDNFGRSLKADGTRETAFEAVSRLTPWRSGMISNYMERKREMAEEDETAATLTNWLQDSKNREKWDGTVGTASWLTQMEKAGESNDQFSYRKAQMGMAVNDAIMLSKLKETSLHESIIEELQKMSQVTKESQIGQGVIQSIRNSAKEEYQDKTDDEIIEKVNNNANNMLGLLSSVEKEGKDIDRTIGRVDDDTRQSLIFGKLMEKDFTERRDKLNEEIDGIKSHIAISASSNSANLDDEATAVLRNYGSFQNAFHEHEKLENKKEKLKEKEKALSAISKDNRSKQQTEELKKVKSELKEVEKQKEAFAGIYKKNDKGERTEELNTDLLYTTLNEQDIMNLDAATRAVVLANGAKKVYNASHQNRQKVDALNQQISEIQDKIDAIELQKQKWLTEDGRIKKGHNKQVARTNKAVEKLNKDKSEKLKELSTEMGDFNTKSIFSEKQQDIIDNLVQQGTSIDEDFIDKVVDVARLDKGIKDYHNQYQAVLTDPNAFSKYVQGVKYKASLDLAKRRAEKIADIDDYKEYAKELNKLTANASQGEMMVIHDTLRKRSEKAKQEFRDQQEQKDIDDIINNNAEGQLVVDENGEVHTEDYLNDREGNESEDNVNTEKEVSDQNNRETLLTNYDKFVNEYKKQETLLKQISKNTTFTDNDISLLIDAMQYLSQNGVDVTDREAAVQSLVEKDEQGNLGGKFRQWVEERNSSVSEQQRAFVPYFTSIGQIVNQYVEVLNGEDIDRINKSSISPTVVVQLTEDSDSNNSHVTPSPIQKKEDEDGTASKTSSGPSLFDMGGPTPESGQFVDAEGTVATGATIVAEAERAAQKKEEKDNNGNLADSEKGLPKDTNPKVTQAFRILDNILNSMTFIEDEKNVKATEEEKTYAKQHLKEALENNTGSPIDTLNDLIDTILTIANDLENTANDPSGHIATIYRSLARRLTAQSKRRSIIETPARRANTKASLISTANIAYMEHISPEAWAVKFTNYHAIDEWHRENTITADTPIYFLTDSAWSAEVMQQMNDNKNSRDYSTLVDMPIVIGVEVESPKNEDTTTAIQVGEKWYQPIGVLPSTRSNVSGAERTSSIRSLASKEQGVHIVTEDGSPNGNPLISYVSGKNYINAHHPDASSQTKRDNDVDNNNSVIIGILNTLPLASVERLQGLSKEEMLNDPEYKEARRKFIDRLSWGEGYTGTQADLNNHMLYTPDDLKHNEGKQSDRSAQPMMLFVKSIDATTSKNSDKTLKEVLNSESADDVVTFNSRMERLFTEVIRPLFEHLPLVDKHKDKSARVITQEDLDADPDAFEKEAQRLTRELRGYDGTKETAGIHGLSDFLFISKDSQWQLSVNAPMKLQTIQGLEDSESKYVVSLEDKDGQEAPIILGTISAKATNGVSNQDNIEAAKSTLKELLKQCIEGGALQGEVYWQVSKNNITLLKNSNNVKKTKARQDVAAIIDDGILDFGGSSLTYDVDGITIKAPVSMNNKIVYPFNQVTNPNNASPSTAIGVTPKAEGGVITKKGTQVESNSGAVLEDSNNNTKDENQKSEELKKAEAVVEKIINDSKNFILSEDETYYYITDKNIGERVKYLRVTSIIEADESNKKMYNPSLQDIVAHLGVDAQVLSKINANSTAGAISELAGVTGKTEAEIRRSIAELRTEHAKTKYEGWGVPSTALGNTADIITRDFFAGELKDFYPNLTDEVLQHFVGQLTNFKNDLDSRGIHIVSKEVMAHGKITIGDSNGNTHELNVAGTLDLFGYDDKGNFYIFDMKTTRNHSTQKLEDERAKWSRQISLYADLLQQTYGIKVNANNLRIIPINVSYPTPRGKASEYKDPMGPVYSKSGNQLKVSYKEEIKDFIIDDNSSFCMRGEDLASQFQPGYIHFNINWDNLSSQNQDIANSIKTELKGQKPSNAEVELSPEKRSITDGMDSLAKKDYYGEGQNPAPLAPPINMAGQTQSPLGDNWETLSPSIKEYLMAEGWVESTSDYNDILNDPSTKEALLNELKCKGII